MVEDGDVLDVDGASRYLGVDVQTIRRLAEQRRVPAFKVAGKWRFKKPWLDGWVHTQRAGRATVLVVDDEDAVRHGVRRMLEGEGFDVTTAAGGREALALMRLTPPDLVLLDLKMPGMDGPAALREIRKDWNTLPVVILTAYPDGDLMSQAEEFAPLTTVAKPFEREQIVAAVRRFVGRPRG